jgi:hypothetical protein
MTQSNAVDNHTNNLTISTHGLESQAAPTHWTRRSGYVLTAGGIVHDRSLAAAAAGNPCHPATSYERYVV